MVTERIRPLVLDSDSVRAILTGKKGAQTLLMRPQPPRSYQFVGVNAMDAAEFWGKNRSFEADMPCLPNEILYVRESWFKDTYRYMYRADYAEDEIFYKDGKEYALKWRPSTVMPRAAARLFLQVKRVDILRIRDLNEADIREAGYESVEAFAAAWNARYGTPQPVNRGRYIDHYLSFPYEDLKANVFHQGRRHWVNGNPWVFFARFDRLKDAPTGFFADKSAGAHADAPVLAPAT